jgi:endonuclease/exonuclease/phosphatase (EEP) superfamily protein YafD
MKKLKRLLFYLYVLIYVPLLLLTLLGASAPWIPVEIIPPLQLAPALLLFLAPLHALTWYWARKKRKGLAFFALLAFLGSLWVGSKDLKWPFGQAESPEGLRVVSYNVRNFNFDSRAVDSVISVLKPLKPDVICFQEFRNYETGSDSLRVTRYLAKALGFPPGIHVRPRRHYQGVAIFSRYPIVQMDTLYMKEEDANNGFLATLQTPQGKVGIGNFHLSSFRFIARPRGQERLEEKFSHALRMSWKTLPLQWNQVEQTLARTDTFSLPLILTADMNAIPHSSLTRPFRERFQDAFLEKGHGRGWTFPLLKGLGVRIDYHWVSPQVEVVSHEVIREGSSDHYPLLGVYRIGGNEKVGE